MTATPSDARPRITVAYDTNHGSFPYCRLYQVGQALVEETFAAWSDLRDDVLRKFKGATAAPELFQLMTGLAAIPGVVRRSLFLQREGR